MASRATEVRGSWYLHEFMQKSKLGMDYSRASSQPQEANAENRMQNAERRKANAESEWDRGGFQPATGTGIERI